MKAKRIRPADPNVTRSRGLPCGSNSLPHQLREDAPLAQLLEHNLANMELRKFSPHTRRGRKYTVRRWLRWLDENCGVHSTHQLKPEYLEAWHKELCTALTIFSGQPIRPSTINRRLGHVRAFLDHLGRYDWVEPGLSRFVLNVKQPRLFPTSVLTHREVMKLLNSIRTNTAEGMRMRAIVEVFYSSGVRLAELLGLDMPDIDYRKGMATVIGKGMKQRRVPLGVVAMRQVKRYVKKGRPQFIVASTRDALFVDNGGKRVPAHTLRRWIHKQSKAAGLTIEVTPQTFRRTCVTELMRCGADHYQVRDLLGHESLQTVRHYIRYTMRDVKATHTQCHPRENGGRLN